MNAYFGDHWGAPMLDGLRQVPTPIGEPCFFCSEPIEEGDAGLFTTVHYTDNTRVQPIHRECNLRMVVGSLGHQRRTCSCFQDPGDDQEDGLTLREAALAAAREFEGR